MAHCDIVLGRELLAEVPGNLPAPMLEVDRHLRLDDVLVVEWSGDYFYWSGVAPGFVSLQGAVEPPSLAMSLTVPLR